MGRTLANAFAACALWLLCGAAVAAGDCPPATPPYTPELFAQAAQQARDRGVMWMATKGGHTSFLYGTFHIGRKEWMAPGPQLLQALRDTDMIALELDPLDPALPAQMAEAASRVKRSLPAPLKQRLKAAWDGQCLPAGLFAAEPSELQLLSLMVALAIRDGLNPVYGSEILLSLIAQGSRRPVVSLETVALQLLALLGQDDTQAAAFIEGSLDDIERGKARRVLVRTADVWAQGDLAQLEQYEQWCECVDTEVERALMARVVEGRNPALADRIDQLHTQGQRVLAGVGALHMIGPAGLPALLEKRGYSVKRLH